MVSLEAQNVLVSSNTSKRAQRHRRTLHRNFNRIANRMNREVIFLLGVTLCSFSISVAEAVEISSQDQALPVTISPDLALVADIAKAAGISQNVVLGDFQWLEQQLKRALIGTQTVELTFIKFSGDARTTHKTLCSGGT